MLKGPKVLIIGCGPAGLGAIEQFRRKVRTFSGKKTAVTVKQGFDVVSYEARDGPGGLWNFDPTPSPCLLSFDRDGRPIALNAKERAGVPQPTPSPLYETVKANTPSPIMTYRGYPYPSSVSEPPTRRDIYAYQVQHAAKYKEFVRFNTAVTRVRYTQQEPNSKPAPRWTVESIKVPTEAASEPNVEQFDYIVVANGSDSRPYIPYVRGLWHWQGEALHSRWYRQANAFAGKTVVLVGNGPSGSDIARELGLLKVANDPSAPKKVYQSIRSPPRYDTFIELGWRDQLAIKPPISEIVPLSSAKHGSIRFSDGTAVDDADVIIFATSYLIRFEFLRPEDEPFASYPLLKTPAVPQGAPKPPAGKFSEEVGFNGGHRVHNLDAHSLFFYPDPTLAFLLLHAEAIPWPFSEMQARVIAAYWSGTPLQLEPHPDTSDSHSILVLGHPGEFTYAENLLKLIGEGGPEEVAADGRWGSWPERKKAIRAAID